MGPARDAPAVPSGYSADVRERLRRDLVRAIKARDSAAVSALRSALAAIENAEAVDPRPAPPPGVDPSPIAGSVAGLRAAEVPRRDLTAAEVEEIVRREMTERLEAADEYLRLGRDEQAGRLREEADVLDRSLTSTAS